MQLRLESLGAVILTAKSGLDGLVLARRERPALIISDIKMPEVNGFEFCRFVRGTAILAATPIILFSALDLTELETQEAKVAGANVVLPSSPDLGELLRAMTELLTKNQP